MNFQNPISEATKLASIYRRASYQFITKMSGVLAF